MSLLNILNADDGYTRNMMLIIRKALSFAAICGIASAYTHMYFEEQALSIYGTSRLGGTNCIAVDAGFGIVKRTVMGKPHPYWLHGCPLFIDR
ncbi:MAG: hypothetical protein AAF737_05145 [Pseudomonadota bacterium]